MQQTNTTYPFYGPEDIKRYLSGSMSAQEMHDMEKAALKDPLLADAIDGFRNADPLVTDTHLNAIKASILGLSVQEKPVVVPLNPSPKKSWWRWVAAACSLGLIAGATWWVIENIEPGAIQPLAKTESMAPSLGDSIRPLSADHTASAVKEKTEMDQVIAAENKGTVSEKPGLKKEQAISAKVSAPAPTEALPAPIAQKIIDDEAIALRKNESIAELKSLKRKEVSDNYVSSMIAASVPSAAPTPNMKTTKFGNATGLQPVAYIEGLVVDEDGAPLANASISVPGRNKTTANNDGSFVLPVYDSSFGVSVNRFGYRNTTALLSPGKTNKIVLNKTPVSLDEIVVSGDNVKHRMKKAAFLEDARKAQASAVSANEVIYPEEGWSHFYEELGTSLGVDKAKKTKTLQIKFTVDDNGDPVDFEVVESPDAIMAKKAIEFIKKAKWKNFKLDKNALVKIEVN